MTIDVAALEELEKQLRNLPLVASILARLKSELPPHLWYHTAAHTDDVIHEALVFSMLDGVEERELELLTIAAAYHDAGFIQQPNDNEGIGAAMAARAMSDAGRYESSEIALVTLMIEDTVLRPVAHGIAQVPRSTLSRYLLDGDVSNLGRPDFSEKAELVRQELGVPADRAFFEFVLRLMKSHQWYSEPARRLRQKQKEENIAALSNLINNLG